LSRFGLLYYLPDAARARLTEAIDAAGLGYAFDGPPIPCEVTRGPQAAQPAGLVVADKGSAPDHMVRLDPDAQTWRPIPGSDAMVGVYTDAPPTPELLARADLLPGHPVELADGQTYIAPVARGLAMDDEAGPTGWTLALPQTVGLDPAGAWTAGDVVPRYRALWAAACHWWDAKHQALDAGPDDDQPDAATVAFTFDFASLLDAALTVLAANYRVGRPEVALLGLFDDASAVRLLDAAIDWPTVQAWLKKKAVSACWSTANGPPGS